MESLKKLKELLSYKREELTKELILKQINSFWFSPTLPNTAYFPFSKMKKEHYWLIFWLSMFIPFFWTIIWIILVQKKLNWNTIEIKKGISQNKIKKALEEIPYMKSTAYAKFPLIIWLFTKPFWWGLLFLWIISYWIIPLIALAYALQIDWFRYIYSRWLIYILKFKSIPLIKLTNRLERLEKESNLIINEIDNWYIKNNIWTTLGKTIEELVLLKKDWKELLNNEFLKDILLELFEKYETIFKEIDNLEKKNISWNIDSPQLDFAKMRKEKVSSELEGIKIKFMKQKKYIIDNFN